MTIYYVTACFEFEGDWSEGAKAFMSIESAEAYKAWLESEHYGEWVEIREMAVEA